MHFITHDNFYHTTLTVIRQTGVTATDTVTFTHTSVSMTYVNK